MKRMKKTPDGGAIPVAGFNCHTRPAADGWRVELVIESPLPAAEIVLEFAPVLAERLAAELLCHCAGTKGRAVGELAYAADRARLRYDPVLATGSIDFSSRGMHGVRIQLSLEALQALREALLRID